MLKGNLRKLLSAAIAAATLLTSTAFAATPAKMTVTVPAETMDKCELPVGDAEGMTKMLNALNGVDADGNQILDDKGNVIKSRDIGGWYLTHSTVDSFITDANNSYLQFGTTTANNSGVFRMVNNETLTGLNSDFKVNINLSFTTGGFDVYIGKVKAFGDDTNDYYRLQGAFSSSPWGAKLRLIRGKGDQSTTAACQTATNEQSELGYYGSMGFNGYILFDGKTVSLYNSTDTLLTSFTPSETFDSGKVYLNAEGGRIIRLKGLSIERPSTTKDNDAFYVALDEINSDEANKTALASAGWTTNLENDGITYAESDKYCGIKQNGNLYFDQGKFAGDYTVTSKVHYTYGYTDFYFNKKDDKNYYKARVAYSYITTLYKCVDGTETELAKVTHSGWFNAIKTFKVVLTNTEDALTISIISPKALTYVDYVDDTKEAITVTDESGTETVTEMNTGSPITSGSVGLAAVNNGKSNVQSFTIYPNAETNPTLDDIKFDLYVDDTKVENESAPKGKVAVAMPTKFAGRVNKVIVALYDNHEMKAAKVFDSIDFARADKIEVFDTTECSDNAQIGMFMWNTLTSIKPLVDETFVNVD